MSPRRGGCKQGSSPREGRAPSAAWRRGHRRAACSPGPTPKALTPSLVSPGAALFAAGGVHNGRMTRVTTPFGFHSTTAEVIGGIDLSGKRAIVTGASSGIGAETARTLAGAGADVTLAVRNTEAGEGVAGDIT